MDIGSVLLILALLILVGLYVSRPLFDRKAVIIDVRGDKEDHDLSFLLAERDRILDALQELDFDYELEKIPREEYPAQRASMLQRGAEILRQIDRYQKQISQEGVESRLEAALASRRATTATGTAQAGDMTQTQREPMRESAGTAMASGDDELEAQIAARRRTRQDKSAGFCPQCGRPVQKADSFCPKCGTRLHGKVE